MIHILFLIIISLAIYFSNLFFIKKKFLLNSTGDPHQSFISKTKVTLSGGVFLIVAFIILSEINLINKLIFILFYLIGFFSDLKIFKSPIIRLISQILLILIFILKNNLFLENTRVIFLDYLLNYELFNIIFIIFCITIIINGTNFIDGVNCNVIGYYLIISLILYYLNLFDEFNSNIIYFRYWIFVLLLLYILNFTNKLYLGDNGSYFLGFIYSYSLINIYLNNQNLSPFFIILLLWYPAFENLFSLLRKINFNKSPLKPDQNHLHQLLFFFIKKKKIANEKFINSTTGNIILTYNLCIFLFACINPFNTQYQILLIVLNISIYSFFYINLFKFKYKKIIKTRF